MTNSLTELAALNRIADAIEQLIAKSGSGSGGGGDCGCMSDLTCILAPLVASQIQANKAIISLATKDSQWTENDEGNAWPDPRDTDPPISYTPPVDGTIPIGSEYPPGGLGGASDAVAYGVYRCDFAWYMVDYLIAYWESVLEIYSTAHDGLGYLSMFKNADVVYDHIRGRLAKEVVKEGLTGTAVILTKETTKFGLKAFLTLFFKILDGVLIGFIVVTTAMEAHIKYLKTRRKAMVCALLKGKDATESIDNLNYAAEKLWWNVITGQGSLYPWKWQNSVILGGLAKNLFACEAGYDFSVLNGYADEFGEGCDECDFACEGATERIDFNDGKQGWTNPNPPALPAVDFGQIWGTGKFGETTDPANAVSTGLIGWKGRGAITIDSLSKPRNFTQVCVKFGGFGAGSNFVMVYVNGVAAMSKTIAIPLDEDGKVTSVFETVLLNIEEDKRADYPNENLVNNKFSGVVSITRDAGHPSSSIGYGEARIFAVAFG